MQQVMWVVIVVLPFGRSPRALAGPQAGAPYDGAAMTSHPDLADPGSTKRAVESRQSLGPTNVVGVGPHARPWPDDPRLDPVLLAEGDRRNVVDRYRYWRVEAIVTDLDRRRHPFHVAIENWQHDHNIGAVVRNANAFLAGGVHIVGRRKWNRRGAMVTERYQHVLHHDDVGVLLAWARERDLPLIGVDNLPGSADIRVADLPRACVLLFGQEGPGLSEQAREAITGVLSIPQFGSTRSINAGVASGIAMYEWIRRHAGGERSSAAAR
jgi:tRNA(Leu) C34 or U34 (ribose-2'-O)-methylase TrmL